MPRVRSVPKHKGFKGVVIAYSDDLPNIEKTHIRNWIEHAGGRLELEYCDRVTHFIVSRKAWNSTHGKQEHIIRSIRKEKCCYLMTFAWLKDSLSHNKGKPILESTKNYSVEPKHAEKVRRKIEVDKKAHQHQIRKEKARRKRLLAAGQDPDEHNSDAPNHDPVPSATKNNKQNLTSNGSQPGNSNSSCVIKFDKSLFEFERDMAMSGYKPYVDANQLPYLVTLRRGNERIATEDQYLLKLYESYQRPPQLPKDADVVCESILNPHSNAAAGDSILSKASAIHDSICRQQVNQESNKAKQYALYVHYTKYSSSARDRANEILQLAPPGSTWNFAYGVFCRFFKKKTGREWEEVVESTQNRTDSTCKDERRDSGVGIGNSRRKSAELMEKSVEMVEASGSANGPGGELVEVRNFDYVPGTTAQTEWIRKEYEKKYGEPWLFTSHPLGSAQVGGDVEKADSDRKLAAQSRPDDEGMELVYDEGCVGEMDVERERQGSE